MYFLDQLKTDQDPSGYIDLLGKFAALLRDSVTFLWKHWNTAQLAAYGKQEHQHATILMLSRHVCEELDGVSVLAEKGCAEPCKPLMRSTYEAILGIEYILEADSERRAMAYQLAHAHRKISFYRKLDPNEQSGKELRALSTNDSLAGDTEWPTLDTKPLIANLENLFKRPEFQPIEAEWQLRKGKAAWHALFGGPNKFRDLAIHLKHGITYEFHYRHWSNSVHAGDVFSNIAGDDGLPAIKPIRHPEGLQSMVSAGVGFCLCLSRMLLNRYGTQEQRESAQRDYTTEIQPNFRQLLNGELIEARWHSGPKSKV
jgi:hypothetical protein